MKFLITGGCGFLGSNLASHILKNKLSSRLVILDNLSRLGSKANLEWLQQIGKFTFVKKNIQNKLSTEEVIKKIKPDVVFHLAGQVAMTTSIKEPYDDFKTNTYGSIILLESIRKFSPKTKVIFSSTNKVYGDLSQIKFRQTKTRYLPNKYKNGLNEDIHLSFSSPYGCSKGSADQYFLDYAHIYNLNTVVLRHSSIFGERQFSTSDQGWIGWFIEQALKIKKKEIESITIHGDGKQVRDILFSDDLIKCYFSVIENFQLCKGHAFNIGGGINNSLSLLELFNLLEDQLKIKIILKKNDWRISDQKFFVSDNIKIYKHTGWKPKKSAIEGILSMINWIQEINGIKN